MSDLTPQGLHALSGAYVVDALDDDERARFEAHLPGCADCRDEVAGLREAAALLPHAAAAPAPASLRDSVLAGITKIRPLPPETHESAQGRPAAGSTDAHDAPVAPVVHLRLRRRVANALVAAAAVVVVGVGLAWHPWNQPSTSTTLSAADEVLGASDARHVSLDLAGGASATVVRSAKQGRAVIVTHGMPAAPSGKTYELWLRDAAGTMHPAGLMRAAGDQKMLLDGDADRATAVGITVEPAAGSSRPTSTPIALFDLGQASA